MLVAVVVGSGSSSSSNSSGSSSLLVIICCANYCGQPLKYSVPAQATSGILDLQVKNFSNCIHISGHFAQTL